jgi:nitrate reductase beta subunit
VIWLTWRQFRVQAAVVAGVLALVAIVAAVTGPHLVDLYDACKSTHTCGQSSLNVADNRLQAHTGWAGPRASPAGVGWPRRWASSASVRSSSAGS